MENVLDKALSFAIALLRLPRRAWIAVGWLGIFFGVVLLLTSWSIARVLGGLPHTNALWFPGVATLVAGISIFSAGVTWPLCMLILNWIDDGMHRRRGYRTLRHLTREQGLLLQLFLAGMMNWYYPMSLPMWPVAIGELVADDIIYPDPNARTDRAPAYYIRRWAWEYLHTHPELVQVSGIVIAPPAA